MRIAGQRRPAGFGLYERVIARLGAAVAGATIGGERDTDDGGVRIAQALIGQAELLDDVAPQVRVHGVGAGDQSMEDILTRRCFEVQQHAALTAIEGVEIQAVGAVLSGPHVPADVAASRWVFEPDDFGAEIREVERAKRASTELFHGDDAQILERSSRHDRMVRRYGNELVLTPTSVVKTTRRSW